MSAVDRDTLAALLMEHRLTDQGWAYTVTKPGLAGSTIQHPGESAWRCSCDGRVRPRNVAVAHVEEAFLASDWLAQERRRVAAQTLRDAADDAVNLWQNTGGGGDIRETVAAVARWLTDRADTHEKEQP